MLEGQARNIQKWLILVTTGRQKASLTAKNPRRHAAGRLFHTFLTRLARQGLASLRFIN